MYTHFQIYAAYVWVLLGGLEAKLLGSWDNLFGYPFLSLYTPFTCIVCLRIYFAHINMYIHDLVGKMMWLLVCTVQCVLFMPFPAHSMWTFFGLFFFSLAKWHEKVNIDFHIIIHLVFLLFLAFTPYTRIHTTNISSLSSTQWSKKRCEKNK